LLLLAGVRITIPKSDTMRLLLGFVMLFGLARLEAATKAIEMAFVGGKVDYVTLPEKPFRPNLASWDWRNLESFVIKYRGWSLLGEYVYRAEFYYALNRDELRGAKRTVRFADLEKYPDLVKRYRAIRPGSVNFVLRARVQAESGPRLVSFKVTDNDLVYFGSRSGENYSTPGSPAQWKDVVSLGWPVAFKSEDATTDAELNKFFAGFRSVSELPPPDAGVLLDIKWPDTEIDRIGELYEQYEKEGQKLAEAYAFLDDAPQTPPFAGRGEEAQPHDFRLKPGEVFREGNEVGLKVNGQIVFRSSRHGYASEFDSRKTHFFFVRRDGSGSEIYDTKGRQVKVGGYSRMTGFNPSRRGHPRVIGLPDQRSVVYQSQQRHRNIGVLTQGEFDRFVRIDGTPPPPVKPSKGGGITITARSYYYEFERVELLEVDETFNVLSREPAYSARSFE
jgi:hypothetical protein